MLVVRTRIFVEGKHDFVSSPVFTKTKDGHRVRTLPATVLQPLMPSFI